jgi:hypothetical protein
MNLQGRQARCAYCKTLTPSNIQLPFFEFLGEGSKEATQICKCGYYHGAHNDGTGNRIDGMQTLSGPVKCSTFEAQGPREFDRYYCGCRGWD